MQTTISGKNQKARMELLEIHTVDGLKDGERKDLPAHHMSLFLKHGGCVMAWSA